MLTSATLVAFAATTDLARARLFFERTLGLPCLEQDAHACVFDAHGTSLRVTAVDEVAVTGYTVLGWVVDDVDASARALTERGVSFTRYDGLMHDEVGIWTAPNGARVAWFRDPDGNTLSITQI